MNKRYVMVKNGKVLTSIVTSAAKIPLYQAKYPHVDEFVLVDPDDGSLGRYWDENVNKDTATWDGVKFTSPDMTVKTAKEIAKEALVKKADDYQPTMKELKDAGVI